MTGCHNGGADCEAGYGGSSPPSAPTGTAEHGVFRVSSTSVVGDPVGTGDIVCSSVPGCVPAGVGGNLLKESHGGVWFRKAEVDLFSTCQNTHTPSWFFLAP